MPRGVRVADEVRLRAMELIADGWSASAAARELGVSHTAVGRWAREAGVGLAMGAVGGSALAAARRRRAVFEAWAAGAGRAGAARAGGVSIRTAGRWLHDTRMSTAARPVAAVESAHGGEVLRRGRRGGAVRPSDHRGPDARVSGRAGRGLRLGAGERAMIAAGLAQGDSAALIARRIGRCRQTVSREIRRGAGPDGVYRPAAAQAAARARLARPKIRKLDADPALRERVVDLLEDRVSPRQIAARLRFENPDDESMRICHEQIYQALYVQGAGGLRAQLRVEKALRTGRTRRIPRSPLAGLPKPRGKSWIRGATISLRPPEADDRAVPGHWEGDLIIGGDSSSALITLVERTSRFVLISRLADNHRTRTVTDALKSMVDSLPRAVYSTITWDQGAEMADHAAFTLATDIKVYFADPHSPWQRPTNENTNGLIREYFPKGTDFNNVTDAQVRAVQDQLNRRPREVLNGQTPTEILDTIINGATTT